MPLAEEGCNAELAVAEADRVGVLAELCPLKSFGEVPMSFLVVTQHPVAHSAVIIGQIHAVRVGLLSVLNVEPQTLGYLLLFEVHNPNAIKSQRSRHRVLKDSSTEKETLVEG